MPRPTRRLPLPPPPRRRSKLHGCRAARAARCARHKRPVLPGVCISGTSCAAAESMRQLTHQAITRIHSPWPRAQADARASAAPAQRTASAADHRRAALRGALPPDSRHHSIGPSTRQAARCRGKPGHHHRARGWRVGQRRHQQRRLQQTARPGHPGQADARTAGRATHRLPAFTGPVRHQVGSAAAEAFHPARLPTLPEQEQAQRQRSHVHQGPQRPQRAHGLPDGGQAAHAGRGHRTRLPHRPPAGRRGRPADARHWPARTAAAVLAAPHMARQCGEPASPISTALRNERLVHAAQCVRSPLPGGRIR